jgi:hypothetical protein
VVSDIAECARRIGYKIKDVEWGAFCDAVVLSKSLGPLRSYFQRTGHFPISLDSRHAVTSLADVPHVGKEQLVLYYEFIVSRSLIHNASQ